MRTLIIGQILDSNGPIYQILKKWHSQIVVENLWQHIYEQTVTQMFLW